MFISEYYGSDVFFSTVYAIVSILIGGIIGHSGIGRKTAIGGHIANNMFLSLTFTGQGGGLGNIPPY